MAITDKSLDDYELTGFKQWNKLLIGVGEEEPFQTLHGKCFTYKNRIYDTGIIGFGLLVFVVIFTSKQKTNIFIYLLFSTSMYQRADVLRYSYIFIFVGLYTT